MSKGMIFAIFAFNLPLMGCMPTNVGDGKVDEQEMAAFLAGVGLTKAAYCAKSDEERASIRERLHIPAVEGFCDP